MCVKLAFPAPAFYGGGVWNFKPVLEQRLAPLRNALGVFSLPLSRRELLELWNLAQQSGTVGPPLVAWLQNLPLQSAARRALNALVEASQVGLEVERQRWQDETFQARVSALRQHVQPGDLLFWGSPEPGWPWNFMRSVYGPWMHVSLVLAPDAWLDPYWPEGAVIVSPEDATAKASRRIRATEIAIARPSHTWDEPRLARLRGRAIELYGLPYSLMGTPSEPMSTVSCSRAAWAALRAAGVDLLADRERLFVSSIAPRDIFRGAMLHVRTDGSVSAAPPGPDPRGFAGEVVRQAENFFSSAPGVDAWVLSTGPFWTVSFMTMMNSPSLEDAFQAIVPQGRAR